jgi:fructose-1,6-bisphosphatase/inositol monophosphatase family enzyme
LNGEPIHATASEGSLTLQESMLCLGNPPDPGAFQKNLKVLAELGPRVRGVRILSSAALVYSWVALGRITAYVASDINGNAAMYASRSK